MGTTREILRLFHEEELSCRQISAVLSVSASTVSRSLGRARSAGLSWPLPDGWDEAELSGSVFPPRERSGAEDWPEPPDWERIEAELLKKRQPRRVKMTRRRLWEAYLDEVRERGGNALSYSRFCHHLQARSGSDSGGDLVFEYFPGQTGLAHAGRYGKERRDIRRRVVLLAPGLRGGDAGPVGSQLGGSPSTASRRDKRAANERPAKAAPNAAQPSRSAPAASNSHPPVPPLAASLPSACRSCSSRRSKLPKAPRPSSGCSSQPLPPTRQRPAAVSWNTPPGAGASRTGTGSSSPDARWRNSKTAPRSVSPAPPPSISSSPGASC